jgi:Flp pilus assembly protein TadB
MKETTPHMERKRFLATAAGVGAALASVSAALAAPAPVNTMAPTAAPTHHWMRGETRSNRNIRQVRRHLEHVIDELQHDQQDYAGHRVKALDLLNQARQELLLAEQTTAASPHP